MSEAIKGSKQRLKFAQDHANWTVDQGKNVIWSDKTWIQVRENGRIQFVRRRVGEAFHPNCVVTTTKHPVKVMRFGTISHVAKSNIIFIDGSVNTEKYQEMLEAAKIKYFIDCHNS